VRGSAELAQKILRGDRLSLARGITLVESTPGSAPGLLKALRPPRRAFIVGVTGPPGTGKSTLVDRLISQYRKKNLRVGVIAVDPSSPITGGALLGDRIRMAGHGKDTGVFIRSMASRGWTGGLSRATSSAVQILDAAGFDLVLLETVGIGQSDVEVVGITHAVIVVLMPGLGDDVQVSKAGLMEVGDIYVVNKADLEGANQMVTILLGALRGRPQSPSVLRLSALPGKDIAGLVDAIEEIRARFSKAPKELNLRSLRGMIVETARGNLAESLQRVSESKADEMASQVLLGRLTVEEAALRIFGN